jgi:protein O-GlcNAc transferase
MSNKGVKKNSDIDMTSKESVKKNYKRILELANAKISASIETDDKSKVQTYRLEAIDIIRTFVDKLDLRDYLLLDSNPEVPQNIYCDSYFTLGTLYKTYVETEMQSDINLRRKNEANRSETVKPFSKNLEQMFREALNCFVMILRVRFEDDMALKQITSIYTYMSLFAGDLNVCLSYMNEALLYVPNNPTIHYNLGYIHQRLNRLDASVIHYKLSIHLMENIKHDSEESKEECRRLRINDYNGISGIFRSLKQWPEALHYLLKAERIDALDPDIQNQLGVVYTEMRRTDLAEVAYNKAIKNYKRAFVSTDHKFLLSELYLNLGHMHSYNGDNHKSVECYNKSLQTCPRFNLPFQNKIMNLNYLFDQLEDKMYITNQHRLVNKLYKGIGNNPIYKFDKVFYNTQKINIGIISGDFVDHPVSFFISTFLKRFDNTRFNVTCYSECLINTGLYNDNLKFTTIKNLSAEQAADVIYNDKVHVLFDLAGHTAFNRLDVFALKPSPIQITYIGYPFTTGLNEMNYRITDNICDGDLSVSQKFYTERLIALKNCFLCYDPTVISNGGEGDKSLHQIKLRERDGFINIGCFNRINKITEGVVDLFNKVLLAIPRTRLIFKTKALINKKIRENFISRFDKSVRDRIRVLECTITHDDHLLTYNEVDIAVDTFPYSGTTTTCEALYMGVPVFSVYDDKYYFHAQNVSCSILKNSGLEEYIIKGGDDLIERIRNISVDVYDKQYWIDLKNNTRSKFTSGLVCDKIEYMKNFQGLIQNLFENHKNNKL